jgi:hypothetical protein
MRTFLREGGKGQADKGAMALVYAGGGFFKRLIGDIIRNQKANLTPGHTRPDDRL